MKQCRKLFRQSLSLLLVFLLLLSVFTACDKADGETTTEEVTTEAETEPVYLSLVNDGKTSYTILCSDDASDTIKTQVLELQQTLSSLTGATFGASTDLYNPYKETLPERAYEILIGDTNRVESSDMKTLIRERDFIIGEKNDRIVILGGNEQKTLEAVEYFINHYVTSDKNIVVQQGGYYISRFAYNIGLVSIDGVDLMKYRVVVPKDPDTLFPYYAALNLIDLLAIEAGVNLPLVYDDEEPTEYEIVIGETNRAESISAAKTTLKNNQYILKKVDGSIYMYGKTYMVGGAVSEFVNSYLLAESGEEINIVGLPQSNLTKTFVFPDEATSALLLIGDGMGDEHINYTFKDRSDTFLATYLENIGTCTTYPYEGKTTVTDSAASATALSTGYKTKNSYLGVDHNNISIRNVRELASSVGAKTAVLTSDVITGATPAAFLCHYNSRKATDTLQKQINQLLRGSKKDSNLLFATSVNDYKDQLLPETRNILYTLANEGETYFAMIEEAYIDKRSHSNDLSGMKTCVLRYNDVIGYAIEFVLLHPETALIITADHECGGLVILDNGTFYYTSTNHTGAKVPVYAIGPGTDIFDNTTVDNTEIGKFLGSVFTDDYFGDPSLD